MHCGRQITHGSRGWIRHTSTLHDTGASIDVCDTNNSTATAAVMLTASLARIEARTQSLFLSASARRACCATC